jgi:predicted ATPase/DNA-binding winged helix-turn-helix (wHTH) protein
MGIQEGVILRRDEMNIMDARSKGPLSPDLICFGPFRLSVTERVLEKEGVRVRLGSRALDILIALVERPAEVVTKKQLFARVWPDLVVDEGNLRYHVSALRKALGEGVSGTRYVTNVSGRGYCFVVPISRAASPPTLLSNSLAHSPVGLPPSPTRMVGRDETVQLISEELIARRFLTIVGPGGIGKTTVATAVSRAMLAAFDGAVHYVDFGPPGPPPLVPNRVASTVGLTGNFDDPLAAVPAFLRDRRMLLVLDSCEHLVETVAPLVERIFREAPEVHILTTSREPLQVEGEQVYRIHPLAFPADDESLTATQALAFPAVRLFVERAAEHGSGFELNDADAPIVGKVCRRLDGIALALELAAGRVGVHGVEGIASLLDGPCRLLWQGRRTASPRHQTLSAMLDWSYILLPESERMIFRRLSVFVGAFSLEAAQFVVAGDILEREQVAEAIAGLVTKSLVAVETNRSGTLYRLLDTTRAYVLAKMIDSGERNTIAQRHAIYYREFLERVPEEDQGAFFIAVQLPDGASVARTSEVTKEVEALLKQMPAIEHTVSIIGFSLLDGGNEPNAAFMVARLKPFADRKQAADSAQALIRRTFDAGSQIRQANVLPFNLPPIIGLSTSGGFEYQLEALEGQDPVALGSVMGGLIAGAN